MISKPKPRRWARVLPWLMCLACSAPTERHSAPDVTATTPPPLDAAGDGRAALCPTFGEAVVVGTIASNAVVETSGLVASRRWPETLWLHNDSGDGPRLFAVAYDGETRAEVLVQGAMARDWEDLAIGPGPAGDLLYIGDIGDNARQRAHVVVYRLPEPDLDTAPSRASDVVAFRLVYPDGSHNAETLLVDPLTGDLLIVTKDPGGASSVYRASAPLDPADTTALHRIADLPFGGAQRPGSPFPTAGDLSADGLEVVIRTYSQGFWWPRDPQAPWDEVFHRAPCPVALLTDPKAEAVAFDPVSGDLLTVSEGEHPVIRRFPRLRAASQD